MITSATEPIEPHAEAEAIRRWYLRYQSVVRQPVAIRDVEVLLHSAAGIGEKRPPSVAAVRSSPTLVRDDVHGVPHGSVQGTFLVVGDLEPARSMS